MVETLNTKPFYKGNIPSDWCETKLGEESELITKGTTPTSIGCKFKDKGINFIKIESLEENGNIIADKVSFIDTETHNRLKRSQLRKNDILISIAGALGRIAIVSRDILPANTNQALAIVRLKSVNKLELGFLFYYLNSPYIKKHIELINVQAAQANLSLADISNFKIHYPPTTEQRAIVHILSLMDSAINKNNQLIAQKELQIKWLMQNLLTAKKRLKGSYGEWKELHIRDISKEVSIRNREDKQLTVLSCTKYDGLVPSLEYFGRKIYSDDVSTYKIVPINHFAYATNHIEEGSIGYQEKFAEALISPMYTIFMTDDTVNDIFFYKLLKSHQLIYEYNARMEGSIDRRGGLRWDAFSIIKIKLPSYEEQAAIAQVLQVADKEINILKTKTEKLREQKKGMMQVLLTGKKRLKI